MHLYHSQGISIIAQDFEECLWDSKPRVEHIQSIPRMRHKRRMSVPTLPERGTTHSQVLFGACQGAACLLDCYKTLQAGDSMPQGKGARDKPTGYIPETLRRSTFSLHVQGAVCQLVSHNAKAHRDTGEIWVLESKICHASDI
jgi:hypothetical protein